MKNREDLKRQQEECLRLEFEKNKQSEIKKQEEFRQLEEERKKLEEERRKLEDMRKEETKKQEEMIRKLEEEKIRVEEQKVRYLQRIKELEEVEKKWKEASEISIETNQKAEGGNGNQHKLMQRLRTQNTIFEQRIMELES